MARRKKISQGEVSEGLRRLAFGEITDAVSLLYKSEEEILRSMPSLDLFNVSEIKRPKGGGMEIKFFDRLKAIDRLQELAERQNKEGQTSFYEALEKSALTSGELYGETGDEQL